MTRPDRPPIVVLWRRAIRDDRALTKTAKYTALMLAEYMDADGWACPSHETLAFDTKQSKSTVSVALLELHETGWLERKITSRRAPAEYQAILPSGSLRPNTEWYRDRTLSGTGLAPSGTGLAPSGTAAVPEEEKKRRRGSGRVHEPTDEELRPLAEAKAKRKTNGTNLKKLTEIILVEDRAELTEKWRADRAASAIAMCELCDARGLRYFLSDGTPTTPDDPLQASSDRCDHIAEEADRAS